jgi:hypothetical protein
VEVAAEAGSICAALDAALAAWELRRLLGGPYDERGAVLTIQVCVCDTLSAVLVGAVCGRQARAGHNQKRCGDCGKAPSNYCWLSATWDTVKLVAGWLCPSHLRPGWSRRYGRAGLGRDAGKDVPALGGEAGPPYTRAGSAAG